MYSAFVKELGGRLPALGRLEALSAQLEQLGCPAARLAQQAERVAHLRAKVVELQISGASYKGALDAELARQLQLDEMRLAFAERAEALRLWQEESLDQLGEHVVADSVAEAEQQLALLGGDALGGTTLGGFEQILLTKRRDADELAAFTRQMAACGISSNPYSRFSIDEMQQEMEAIDAALAERRSRLHAALAHQRELEQLKRRFAGAAEAVLKHVAAEKAQLEQDAPAITIAPGDAEAKARGTAAIARLEARQTAEAKAARAALLAPAEELAEELLRQGELHNPFSHHTVPSLKSVLNQLEKLLKDRQLYLEAQLTRAEVSISKEHHAELVAAFKHFDKDGSGGLDKKEFVAALQSMDLAMKNKEMEQAFADYSQPAGKSGELTISQDAYITCVLKFYADNDTSDSLVDSFRQLAGGKEWVTAADVQVAMGEANAEPLLTALAPFDTAEGFDYAAFVRRVYGPGGSK